MKIHRLASLLMFLLAALLVVLPFAVAFAQKPVKTDVLPYFDRIPAPPTAFSPALKRPAALAELDKQLNQLLAGISTGRTAEQTRDEQAHLNTARQAQAAGMDKMTDQQKMAYMQQHGAGTPGYNAQAMQLAQQMQDPAFQAKLAKMSDAEKAQFMQAQMAPAGSTQQRMVSDPSFQAAQADFMQQMKNPAFRAAWDKKSEAEQDAYMQQLMRKHGMDESKMKAIGGTQRPAKLAPLVATPALEANSKMMEAFNAEMSGNAFTRVQQQLQTELEAVKQEQQAKHQPEAREGDCAGQRKNFDFYRQFTKRRLDLYTKYLPQLGTAWATQKALVKNRVTPYQTELAKIHYGDDIQRPEEKNFMSALASGQQVMVGQVQQLVGYSSAFYDLNKEYTDLKAAYDQPFKCEEAVCFPAYARVALPEGREIHISKVRPGDVVLGYDALTGKTVPTRVLRLDIHDEQKYPLVQLTIGAQQVYADLDSTPGRPYKPATELTVTPNHPIVTAEGQQLRADELRPSDNVLQLGSAAAVETTHLTDRQDAGAVPIVYNLRTETGNYFVGGVLVGSK
ncbi:Hint domain-containing protein [Hymenobacter sp. 15J16-1T3B]|uniref:Hint domain-containing protein n=1 Tax=Hymenobacter sp. 15J16-1T3B TaxID=2886941 RepID=UPI001D0F7583|nr:Hint domain-containing protein [Hymenobacter sp. 15J16-1T3B]MCC3159551.1 Hint domain-containing protein [Hymenobacter sp. 15J16-1T3B]